MSSSPSNPSVLQVDERIPILGSWKAEHLTSNSPRKQKMSSTHFKTFHSCAAYDFFQSQALLVEALNLEPELRFPRLGELLLHISDRSPRLDRLLHVADLFPISEFAIWCSFTLSAAFVETGCSYPRVLSSSVKVACWRPLLWSHFEVSSVWRPFSGETRFLDYVFRVSSFQGTRPAIWSHWELWFNWKSIVACASRTRRMIEIVRNCTEVWCIFLFLLRSGNSIVHVPRLRVSILVYVGGCYC